MTSTTTLEHAADFTRSYVDIEAFLERIGKTGYLDSWHSAQASHDYFGAEAVWSAILTLIAAQGGPQRRVWQVVGFRRSWASETPLYSAFTERAASRYAHAASDDYYIVRVNPPTADDHPMGRTIQKTIGDPNGE